MPQIIDARGMACPTPVLLAREALMQGEHCTILVDNTAAVENLTRLGHSQNRPVQVTAEGADFRVCFAPGTAEAAVQIAAMPPTTGGDAIFIGRDGIGSGDQALGTSLMRMFFYTLTQADKLPAAILLMNAGVKLATVDTQVSEHLRTLIALGVEVLVCGTCLNFYGLSDQLQAGVVSNMYDILTKMQMASKVITL